MTREEFREIDNISDLLDFCGDWGCYVYDEMYDEDEYSGCIDDEIESMIRYDKWTEIRDYLYDLPDTDFDYYRRTDDGWEGLYNDGSDFDNLKDEVQDWAEDHCVFDNDEEEESEPDEREEREPDECEEDEEEKEPDEPFTLGELVAVCKSSVQKIEDKSKDDPVKTRDEEHVETCDPVAFLR